MKVHLYCILWNEAAMLPYFFRHYDSLVDHYFFYDQASTDGTRELIEAHPYATLREQTWKGLDNRAIVEFHSQEYRKSRGEADWVVIVDIDEFVYHPEFRQRLFELQMESIVAVKTSAYQMVSKHSPTGDGQIYDEIPRGVPEDPGWGKLSLLWPMVDVSFTPGRHQHTFLHHERILTGEFKLLHYHALGLEYLAARNALHCARIPEKDRGGGFSKHTYPGFRGKYDAEWFAKALASRRRVIE